MQPPLPAMIAHIHFIAICGTGMGSLAILLKEQGYKISGSDQNIYPPMSIHLEKAAITILQGYDPKHLDPTVNLVIVGNAVSKTNPLVEEVLKRKISYLSMPQALNHFFITGKKSIVVAGTHGKTTTTALLSHALKKLGARPSYLVGGVPQDGGSSCCFDSGDYFVIEGDEYDTAFFDKGPKFLHYQPYYTLITSLEFDHADIYRDLEHLTESFSKLVQATNPKGFLLLCSDYPELLKLKKQFVIPAPARGGSASGGKAGIHSSSLLTETYGTKGDWEIRNLQFSDKKTQFEVLDKGIKKADVVISLPGKHNAINALACFVLLTQLGYQAEKIAEALASFSGVKRRQEIRGIVKDIIVIDDFAHHPTAVKETINAIKNRYPDYTLYSVFEPRSNSSKRNIFQKDYAQAFGGSNQVILADVFMPSSITDGKILDVDQLVFDITAQGIKAQHISGVDVITQKISDEVKPHSVILIMSNGGFGEIHDKILQKLKSIQ